MNGDRGEFDVLIVGGGLVGSLLANMLSRLPLRVAMIEARNVGSLEQPSFDGRATALANGSQRVFEQLGLWDAMRSRAQPIRFIHIGEQGCFGAARIDAAEEGVAALGYTVENRTLGETLWRPLVEAERFTCIAPAELIDLAVDEHETAARVERSGSRQTLAARLVVAADGANSHLRRCLGIEARIDDYDQCAIVVNCTTEIPHRGRAFERFTRKGPFAVLPLTGDRVAVVWTLPRPEAEDVLASDEDAFRRRLQKTFGYRLGRFGRIGVRDSYPLRRVRSQELIRGRTVLIGNAAVALHPVAGQGFNLALRDAAALAEVIADASGDPAEPADVGAARVLRRYRDWRVADQRKLAAFTHALVRGFATDLPGLRAARGLGLMAFDLLPGAKSLLARHTMGLAGRVPRLARRLDVA